MGRGSCVVRHGSWVVDCGLSYNDGLDGGVQISVVS